MTPRTYIISQDTSGIIRRGEGACEFSRERDYCVDSAPGNEWTPYHNPVTMMRWNSLESYRASPPSPCIHPQSCSCCSCVRIYYTPPGVRGRRRLELDFCNESGPLKVFNQIQDSCSSHWLCPVQFNSLLHRAPSPVGHENCIESLPKTQIVVSVGKKSWSSSSPAKCWPSYEWSWLM